MRATWRLRRCRLVEEAFSYIEDLDFDPMMDERTEKQQKSVDRARAQSHLILRRSLDELRKLQKGRTIQEQVAEQLLTPKPAPQPPQNADQLAQRYRGQGINSFCNPAAPAPTPPTSATTTPAVSKKHPEQNTKMLWRSGRRLEPGHLRRNRPSFLYFMAQSLFAGRSKRDGVGLGIFAPEP